MRAAVADQAVDAGAVAITDEVLAEEAYAAGVLAGEDVRGQHREASGGGSASPTGAPDCTDSGGRVSSSAATLNARLAWSGGDWLPGAPRERSGAAWPSRLRYAWTGVISFPMRTGISAPCGAWKGDSPETSWARLMRHCPSMSKRSRKARAAVSWRSVVQAQ